MVSLYGLEGLWVAKGLGWWWWEMIYGVHFWGGTLFQEAAGLGNLAQVRKVSLGLYLRLSIFCLLTLPALGYSEPWAADSTF